MWLRGLLCGGRGAPWSGRRKIRAIFHFLLQFLARAREVLMMKSFAALPTHRLFSHAATEYVLTLIDDTRALHLRLCDGNSTWAGSLPNERLTPPKTVQVDEFRVRLLTGLCSCGQGASEIGGASSSANAGDELRVEPATAGAVRLKWSATMIEEEYGISMGLGQEVDLAADLLPGDGLRGLLAELVDEVQGLQSAADAHAHRTAALLGEMGELDGVERRLEAARHEAEGGGRRETFLLLLNRKKRRANALNDALNNEFEHDDLDGQDGRSDRMEEEDDEVAIPEGPTEPAAAAAAAAAASGSTQPATAAAASSTAAAQQPAPVKQDADDIFDLL